MTQLKCECRDGTVMTTAEATMIIETLASTSVMKSCGRFKKACKDSCSGGKIMGKSTKCKRVNKMVDLAQSTCACKTTIGTGMVELAAAGGSGSGSGGTPAPGTITITTSEALQTACQNAALAKHNYYRAMHHNTPALALSDIINTHAQEWAEYLAAERKWEHRTGTPYGENLYYGGHSNPFTDADFADRAEKAVAAWYCELHPSGYNFSTPGYQSGAGHFTQVVWKSSTEVGCGCAKTTTQVSGTYRLYVVCNYDPPGNINTEALFAANVLDTTVADSEIGECSAVK